MAEIKKIAKDKQQLKELIKEAPQRCHIEEKDINKANFEKAGIEPPTRAEVHDLFEEFNDIDSTDGVLTKDEYARFIQKILEMITQAEGN